MGVFLCLYYKKQKKNLRNIFLTMQKKILLLNKKYY